MSELFKKYAAINAIVAQRRASQLKNDIQQEQPQSLAISSFRITDGDVPREYRNRYGKVMTLLIKGMVNGTELQRLIMHHEKVNCTLWNFKKNAIYLSNITKLMQRTDLPVEITDSALQKDLLLEMSKKWWEHKNDVLNQFDENAVFNEEKWRNESIKSDNNETPPCLILTFIGGKYGDIPRLWLHPEIAEWFIAWAIPRYQRDMIAGGCGLFVAKPETMGEYQSNHDEIQGTMSTIHINSVLGDQIPAERAVSDVVSLVTTKEAVSHQSCRTDIEPIGRQQQTDSIASVTSVFKDIAIMVMNSQERDRQDRIAREERDRQDRLEREERKAIKEERERRDTIEREERDRKERIAKEELERQERNTLITMLEDSHKATTEAFKTSNEAIRAKYESDLKLQVLQLATGTVNSLPKLLQPFTSVDSITQHVDTTSPTSSQPTFLSSKSPADDAFDSKPTKKKRNTPYRDFSNHQPLFEHANALYERIPEGKTKGMKRGIINQLKNVSVLYLGLVYELDHTTPIGVKVGSTEDMWDRQFPLLLHDNTTVVSALVLTVNYKIKKIESECRKHLIALNHRLVSNKKNGREVHHGDLQTITLKVKNWLSLKGIGFTQYDFPWSATLGSVAHEIVSL